MLDFPLQHASDRGGVRGRVIVRKLESIDDGSVEPPPPLEPGTPRLAWVSPEDSLAFFFFFLFLFLFFFFFFLSSGFPSGFASGFPLSPATGGSDANENPVDSNHKQEEESPDIPMNIDGDGRMVMRYSETK